MGWALKTSKPMPMKHFFLESSHSPARSQLYETMGTMLIQITWIYLYIYIHINNIYIIFPFQQQKQCNNPAVQIPQQIK